ncbi:MULTISPECIES: F510_1955 family glycosylhydrolase [Frankia]|uniref:F510_1955 family glycosylhydrolase n=1 Tax=Frankia TaxID=1854 RepID=UPI0021188A26|nr:MULTISPECIES: hypothetical protein [Frankia]
MGGRATEQPRAGGATSWGRPRRIVLIVGVGVAVLAVAVAVPLLVMGPDSGGRGSGTDQADQVGGVVHVHGLGVDPADGALYAATHMGLFRIPERGAAERVAGRFQDTMGFTVLGAHTFLASGHPDLREEAPPLLGLLESTDAGQNWRPLSLYGKADFHALAAAHGRVYGYDATGGAFLVSVDQKTWDARSRLAMRDFVVSPTDPDAVLAVTEEGLAASRDGGRRWRPVAGAPPLAVLAWHSDGTVWGVDDSGGVWRSEDRGGTWARRGTTYGEPEAMTAAGGALYVAVARRGILASQDGGLTWSVRYSEVGP